MEVIRQKDPKNLSVLERFMLLPIPEKKKRYSLLSDEDKNKLLHNIEFKGRPDQQLPKELLDINSPVNKWLMNWGRGAGKTESAGGNLNKLAFDNPGIRIGIMGTTASEVRDALLYGPSGLITSANPDFQPVHNASARLITWPNGSHALTFSAEEPENLRSQQFHILWMDELAKWRYQSAIWDHIKYIMRLPKRPEFTTFVKPIIIIGTTPRPTALIKSLMKDPEVKVTTSNSFVNSVNLDQSFITSLEKMKGTRLGRQEIEAELLDDNPNGVDGFTYSNFDSNRIDNDEQISEILRNLVKIVVSVDPAVTANKKSDHTGLIVAGKDSKGHGYVIRDATMKGSPTEWAQKAVDLYHLHDCDIIVAETNQGGDMVKTIINGLARTIPFHGVHASRGKLIRAEPIGALYEQNRIHHLGTFPELEQQMVEFNSEIPLAQQKSPDRMDALVWAFTYLLCDVKPKRAAMSVCVI